MALLRNMLFVMTLMLLSTTPALATNGMLMEGYGAISHAMGGASMAFDNGTGAMVNNPATLGLISQDNRMDAEIGILRPDVTFKMGENNYGSDSTAFYMPAIGYIKRNGDWTYGVGIYSQGGMGTDYMDDLNMYSQVIVGKLVVPVAYKVNDRLTVGGSLQFVKADMDLVMGPFDFKNDSDFSGAASGSGITGMVGALYKLNDKVSLGAAYQHEAGIGDITGRGARVKGLDMPATATIGIAAQVTDKLLLAADYKRVFWSESMNTITISQNDIEMQMPQNWNDQNVFSLGLAYNATEKLTLRLGANLANNPIEEHCTPLFPAIIKNHYTAGFGYQFSDTHSLNASFAYAPEVEKANGLNFTGTSTTHSQISYQLMYSFTF